MYANFFPHAIDKIEEQRIFLKNKKIGLGKAKKISLDTVKKDDFSFDRALCNVNVHGVDFECIHSNLQRGYKKLYVFFSSGGGRKKGSEFHRWTWYRYLPGITLHFEDPMFKVYPQLMTAWFYGDQDHAYLRYVAEYVEKFAELFDIAFQDIVFLGSSSGGYASLYAANLFPDSVAIAMNPQIHLQKRKDVTIFQQVSGLSLKKQDAFKRNDLGYISENYRSKFFLMFNIDCPKDYDVQLPFLLKKFDRQLQYPLTKIRNFTFFLTKTPVANPHHVYLLGTMLPLVEGIVRGDFRQDIEDYLALYLADSITNEFLLREKLRNATSC